MNTKKILLPDSSYKGRNRTRKRKRDNTTELHKNSEGTFSASPTRLSGDELLVDQRQRDEAVGLVMIGLSAFSLSLIHYISSSGIPGLINGSMVYLGIGVYIVPVLVGIMGVQKFLERPFQNIGWRVAGSIGTVLFTLGLFYSEGGKIGAWTYTTFAGIFGNIPTKILFFALLLSSAIFALDILYKDVLGALLVACSLTTRFLKFCWEIGLNLISMSIGAVKTTTNFCAVSYKRIYEACSEKQLDPESSLGKLLAFRPGSKDNTSLEENKESAEETNTAKQEISEQNETNNESNLNVVNNVQDNNESVSESKATQKRRNQEDEEEAQIIPVPKLYNPGAEEEAQPVQEEENSNNTPAIQIASISSECIFVNSSISVIAANAISETEEKEVPYPTETEEEKHEEIAQTSASDMEELLGYSETSEEETAESEDSNETIIAKEESKEDESDTKKSAISEETSESQKTAVAETDEQASGKAESDLPETKFVEKEQVYLEDNRIDHEIKQAEKEEAPKKINQYANCKLPPLEILKIPPVKISNADIQSELSYRSAHLLKTLGEFGIKASITDIVQGPAVSRFELKPAPGVKVRQITSLTDDIALSLAAQSIAIEAPIPGKSALGIIIPNSKPTPVYFYNLLNNDEFLKSPNLLQIAVGVTINGTNIYYNLAEMPHLLIAGSTGSGKSVCVNSIIASILFKARPDQVKFIMIDPKMVELSGYNGIPHLIAPVVTDPAKASGALMWAVEEMERRYELLSRCQGVKNISTYNEKLEELRQEVDPSFEPMPYIVIVIDELADLMMTCSAEVEGSICRLTQMARAVGMHLIIATQRPSVNVITGLIKANLPSRIAFSVSSQVDSKTILDAAGAEKLLGKGDMLFLPKGLTKPKRLQGPYVSDNELNDLINFVKSQGKPEYLNIAVARNKKDEDDDEDDEEVDSDLSLIDAIKKYLENQEKTSTSMLQRKFRIGYNRAARIMDQLEEDGIVSPSDGSKQRRVLNGRSNAQI